MTRIIYHLLKTNHNLGYASEAVKIVLDKAFNIYGLNRIIAGTAIDNFASKKVLIKNGFLVEYILIKNLLKY
ncbi:GNAT family N-acetyltransferase [Streptococcus anginosus]|uniref:GNAT family N-acetyltransferase n=1 Tax=Streptococcus anginosus TaxID=1328 RepID=UPI003B63FDA8